MRTKHQAIKSRKKIPVVGETEGFQGNGRGTKVAGWRHSCEKEK